MDPSQFMTWIASGGGAAVALAFVLERMAWFQRLTPDQRGYAVLFGSAALALVAYAYLAYAPAEFQAQASPVFQIVYGVAAAWVASQFAHKQDPAAG